MSSTFEPRMDSGKEVNALKRATPTYSWAVYEKVESRAGSAKAALP